MVQSEFFDRTKFRGYDLLKMAILSIVCLRRLFHESTRKSSFKILLNSMSLFIFMYLYMYPSHNIQITNHNGWTEKL